MSQTTTPVSTPSQTMSQTTGEVDLLLPRRERREVADLLAGLAAQPTRQPFAPEVLAFVDDVRKRLSKRARGMPETEALAYWMRPAEIKRVQAAFEQITASDPDTLLLPRGTVFHVPPANVDTLFVYSWLLSTLVGNRNLVRLSSRATDQSSLILDVLREVAIDHGEIADSSLMLTYGHDDAITSALSAACDVRVIWGGDGTVRAVRRSPLPVHAKELTFPDRFSMAGIGVPGYLALREAERDQVATNFFNDAFWFDQLGCSSARLVIWVGGDPGETSRAATDFYARVRRVVDHKAYAVDTATAVAKLTQAYGSMIDTSVTGIRSWGNELTILPVDAFPEVRGSFCGGGLFYSMTTPSLVELAPHIERRDQTLAHVGIPREQVLDFARILNGRGIDRFVPFGQALQFNRVWDGYDLLSEFSRRVVVQGS